MMKKLFVKPKKNMKSWSNYSIPLLKDMIYIIIFFFKYLIPQNENFKNSS